MLNSISFFLFHLIWQSLARVVITGLSKYKQYLSFKLLEEDERDSVESSTSVASSPSVWSSSPHHPIMTPYKVGLTWAILQRLDYPTAARKYNWFVPFVKICNYFYCTGHADLPPTVVNLPSNISSQYIPYNILLILYRLSMNGTLHIQVTATLPLSYKQCNVCKCLLLIHKDFHEVETSLHL